MFLLCGSCCQKKRKQSLILPPPLDSVVDVDAPSAILVHLFSFLCLKILYIRKHLSAFDCTCIECRQICPNMCQMYCTVQCQSKESAINSVTLLKLANIKILALSLVCGRLFVNLSFNILRIKSRVPLLTSLLCINHGSSFQMCLNLNGPNIGLAHFC